MDPLDDRGSTQDWLIPEDREALATGPAPPSIEDRVEEAISLAREAIRVATGAERAAKRAGAGTPEHLGDLAERVEAALSRLEARELAIERRTAEARREVRSIRSFDERADRIVQRLRDLERSSAAFRLARPARRDPAAAR